MLGRRSHSGSSENINILLVESDLSHAIRDKEEILNNSFSNVTVRLMCDTTAAVQYISGGYKAVGQERPNILLLDDELPHDHSVLVVNSIQDGAKSVVLLLSNTADSTPSKIPVNGRLAKPLNIEELATAIENAGL